MKKHVLSPHHAVRKTRFLAVFQKVPQVVVVKVLALFRAIFWGEGVLKKEKKIESEVVVAQRDKTFRKTILRKVAARLPDAKWQFADTNPMAPAWGPQGLRDALSA